MSNVVSLKTKFVKKKYFEGSVTKEDFFSMNAVSYTRNLSLNFLIAVKNYIDFFKCQKVTILRVEIFWLFVEGH